METIKEVVSWLVAVSGLFMPILFAPQIRLLYREKVSNSLSLSTVWGSVIIQGFVALDAYFKDNDKLMFLQIVSMICLCIIIIQAIYYRQYPGGRRTRMGLGMSKPELS